MVTSTSGAALLLQQPSPGIVVQDEHRARHVQNQQILKMSKVLARKVPARELDDVSYLRSRKLQNIQ